MHKSWHLYTCAGCDTSKDTIDVVRYAKDRTAYRAPSSPHVAYDMEGRDSNLSLTTTGLFGPLLAIPTPRGWRRRTVDTRTPARNCSRSATCS